MKLFYYLTLSFLLLFSCDNQSTQNLALETGISRKLATYRKTQVSKVFYQLSFTIPAEQEKPIPSEMTLTLDIHNLDNPLYLDFNEQKTQLLALSVNGQKQPIRHEKEHLIIAPEQLKQGANTIHIQFLAGELSLNRNADFLYTLLVPDRASTLFPCFDQPDIKANYQLTITAPKDWTVLTGAPEQGQETKDKYTVHHFGKTDKMSTYLFSFVAGKFAVAAKQLDSFYMHFLYRETDPEKIKASLDPVFNLHRQAIDFLQQYTAYPFPFQKLDFAAIPIFQYGGMEHVGAIQYRESTLFLDQTATESQHLARAKLIAHETSHMWFGDLVTMEWFNDVWMKEVFANFMADKIVNPAFPHINHQLQFLLGHYPNAYNEDRTRGSNPIRQELDNLKNAGSLYGGIIYDKAPIMMRQLETAIGGETFRSGVQEYLKKYAYSNANWNNLVEIWDAKSPIDLKKWSDIWVNQSGRPIFTDQIRYEQNQVASFTIRQEAEDGSGKVWPQQFNVAFVYPDSTHVIQVHIEGKDLQLEEAKGLPKPQSILYNCDGLGYGIFPLDTACLKTLASIADDVARGYSYINAYENMLNGSIKPISLFRLLQTGLKTEQNELLIRLLAGNLDNIFWKFLSPAQRDAVQPALESLLWGQLQTKRPANIKKTLFGLFSSTAYSEKSRNQLYRIWKKAENITDLKLNEDDYTGMAINLALYQHPNVANILKEAQAAISNPDKLRRFEFLLPALSTDTATRDAFIESFREQKNREKEDWVLTACNLLHHPLRQASAIKHLKKALELTEEIQRTGDIFFPKGWLNSTIGQYSSKEAYTILNNFLEGHPDFNPILKKKLLQASDDLYRIQTTITSAEIRKPRSDPYK